MKAYLPVLVLFLIFSGSGFAQSNHTITVDGTINTLTEEKWSTTRERFPTSSSTNGYITWDSAFIYIAWPQVDFDGNNQACFIVLDTDPIGSNGSAILGNEQWFRGSSVTVAFKADLVFMIKEINGALEEHTYQYYNNSWEMDGANSSSDFRTGFDHACGNASGNKKDIEFKISRGAIGLSAEGSPVKISVYCKNLDENNGWGYLHRAIPNDAVEGINDKTFTDYYGFLLKDQITQTNLPYYNADIKSFDGGINGTGTDWSTSTNWTSDVLPGSSTLTLIPGDKDVNIGSISTADAYDLVVNGTLTIKSDANGTGSLIQNSNNVTATVERFMNNADWTNGKDGWHFLSSPVALQPISPEFTTDPYDFYTWRAASNNWVNFKDTTDSPTWNTANSSLNFTVGKGYKAAYDNGGTKKFEGTLNVAGVDAGGLIKTSISQINGSWHLLGNPFSSALTWDAGMEWGLSNITGVAQIWNDKIKDYSVLPSFPASIIPATNGFWVKVSVLSGSLILPRAKRVHSVQPFYKSVENEVPQIKLLCSTSDNQSAKEGSIMIYQGATQGYDMMYDGEFLHGFGPTFYSSQGNFKLSLNALPELPVGALIPFIFIKNEASDFYIELKQSIAGFSVYLTDIKTKTDQNLSENPVYAFTSEAGDFTNRFFLHFLNTTGTSKPTAAQIKVYSAPGKINISGVDGKAEILIRNMMGQVVMRNSVNGSTLQSLNTSNLPAGVYVVSVVSGKQTVSEKVVIK